MIRVEYIEAATSYYADVFGLHPRWSGDGSIGLAFQETDAETVGVPSFPPRQPKQLCFKLQDV
jgi:hypothetical protein